MINLYLNIRVCFICMHLIGDSGYPLQPWLMTPIPRPATPEECVYNRVHALTRCSVERCIGLLKTTFRCLLGERKLRYGHEKAAHITYACVILHNFLFVHNFYPDIEEEAPNPNAMNIRHCQRDEYFNAGVQKRNELILRLNE